MPGIAVMVNPDTAPKRSLLSRENEPYEEDDYICCICGKTLTREDNGDG
jgi:hypothetical protein